MANQDSIPRPDGKFNDLQTILVAAVKLNLVPWDIPTSVVANITLKQAAWDAAWLVAKDKKNCTTAQRKTKDTTRKAYEKVLRPFIKKWIYLNENMDDNAIAQCGLTPHDKTRSKVPVPTTLPLIDVVMGKSNVLQCIFRQQLNEPGSSKRGKPVGVAKCEFYFSIDTQPASPDDCTKFAQSGRSPIKVQLPTKQAGKVVWFYARWLNPAGEGGPWTTLDSFVIPF